MKVWSICLQSIAIVFLVCPIPAQADGLKRTETGLTYYQSGNYPAAIETWKQALKEIADPNQQAALLENLARTYQKIGQAQPEIDAWNQLVTLHRLLQNQSALARILTEKAQALSRQGQAQNALVLLCDQSNLQACGETSAIGLARKVGDQRTEAASLGSLGEVYRLQGDYDRAIEVLESALKLATELKIPTFVAAANNSLGNTLSNRAATRYRKSVAFAVQDPVESKKLTQHGQQFDRQALHYYQASLDQPTIDRVTQLQALTNVIPIYQRLNEEAAANRYWTQATQLLDQLPPSRVSAYGAIDLARLSRPVGMRCGEGAAAAQAERLLQKGQAIAVTIGDQRARSFALGALGNLAECAGQWDGALNYSQQAILASQLADRDSLYLWEWQRGRILKQKGDAVGAIAAYNRSIVVLEQVRLEMVQANRDVQFDFRDTIDPIYRELVDLQLSQETTIASSQLDTTLSKTKETLKSNPKPNNLKSTLATLDALKIAELQNYFGNDCGIVIAKDRIDQRVQQDAAVLTTVIGADRTAVIVSLIELSRL